MVTDTRVLEVKKLKGCNSEKHGVTCHTGSHMPLVTNEHTPPETKPQRPAFNLPVTLNNASDHRTNVLIGQYWTD